MKQPPNDIDWERSVPRCESCTHRKPPRTLLVDSRKPVIVLSPVCRKFNFNTRDTALCKHWQNAQGQTLVD